MGDGRQVSETVGEPWYVTGSRGYVFAERWVSVVVRAPCITGRDRESVPVMIIPRRWSVTAVGRSISIFPENPFTNTYETEEAMVYEDGWALW